MRMNVLIINTFDTKGGAARAAYRLHKGFNRIGINSVMLVKEKQSQDERVLQINPIKLYYINPFACSEL